jgi:membrane fusion protein (multidrug efflux system)
MSKGFRDVLVLPEEALVPSGRTVTVWVVDRSVDPPVAARRKVTTGARRAGEVEILDGLQPGELVVVHGTLRVRHGQPVKVIALDEGDAPLSRLLAGDEGGTLR